jgi:hypothetical protein
MIAKLVKGKGFRGALEYNLQQEKGRILATNMAGETPRELSAEFGEIRKLRPNLGKAVMHVSLSAVPGEKLTDKQWQKIGQRYLRGMGFRDNQYIIIRHTDTEHEHIHILANRITHGGEVVSDGLEFRRAEQLMREIERDYALKQVAPSFESERRAMTKGEIEHGLRTGQPSVRQQLQQLCDAAAKDCHSFSEYQARLEAVGVELLPVVQLDGAKLSGLSYRLNDMTMKGSDLGKSYAAAGIQKRGIGYEQGRDFAAVSRCIEREANRAFGESDRGSEASQTSKRRGFSWDIGAIGSSDGSTGRRDTGDVERDREQKSRTKRDVQAPTIEFDERLQSSNNGSHPSLRELEESRVKDGVDALRISYDDSPAYSGSRERLLALAGTTKGAEFLEPSRSSRVSETRSDKSFEAIQKQVKALGVSSFEVGIRDSKTGQMMNREWDKKELENSVAWLKRMSAKGNDLYIRPAGDHGLVLVDDLKLKALERMKADGLVPAATIETSPGNYQAWVKLSDKPLSAEVRSIAAQELAKQYEGDERSADSRHYGRLAGFTNQKPEHTRENGKQPYVLAHECNGHVAKSALRYLEGAEITLDISKARQEQKNRLDRLEMARTGNYELQSDPVSEYQRQAQRLMQRYGREADFSRLDWMIAVDMAKSGRFSAKDIERGIRECSPHVESRKTGHIEDYARRTAEKAFESPEIKAIRQERIDANARMLKARSDELKELFLSGKAVYGERGLEMVQPASEKQDIPSQPLVSEQEKPAQEDVLEPQIREALRLLEEARKARKVDEKRASELFKQAVNLAKEQGKRDAAVGKPMPKVFEKEEPLRDFWKDGSRAYTRSMDRDRGMEMEM